MKYCNCGTITIQTTESIILINLSWWSDAFTPMGLLCIIIIKFHQKITTELYLSKASL